MVMDAHSTLQPASPSPISPTYRLRSRSIPHFHPSKTCLQCKYIPPFMTLRHSWMHLRRRALCSVGLRMQLAIRMNIQIKMPHTGRRHQQRAPTSTHVVGIMYELPSMTAQVNVYSASASLPAIRSPSARGRRTSTVPAYFCAERYLSLRTGELYITRVYINSCRQAFPRSTSRARYASAS